jgi:hypothetical protein
MAWTIHWLETKFIAAICICRVAAFAMIADTPSSLISEGEHVGFIMLLAKREPDIHTC